MSAVWSLSDGKRTLSKVALTLIHAEASTKANPSVSTGRRGPVGEMVSVERAAGFAEVVDSIAEIGQGRAVVFVAKTCRRGNAVVVLIFAIHAEHVGIAVVSGGNVSADPDRDLVARA